MSSSNSGQAGVLVDDDTEVRPPENSKLSDPLYYRPDRRPDSNLHYNIRTISYSALLTLHSCPRRFELNRLTGSALDPDYDEDAAGHLSFGSVVGNGVQEYLISKDLDKAIFRAFLDWKDNLDSDRGEKSAKTFWHAVKAIQAFVEIVNGPLSQYELAYFQGRPAVELGFRVDCGDGFTYRGKLDALLIHRTKREFLPLECKTTGWNYLDEAMYGNSSQGIGYGIVIDRVAHESEIEFSGYDIFYPVYMTKKQEWVPFRFPKSNTSRALWLQSILLDTGDIARYADLGYFPTRGESCFSFGRQCRHYGTCHLSNDLLVGDLSKVPIKLDKVSEYTLDFSMEELVEAQVGRLED